MKVIIFHLKKKDFKRANGFPVIADANLSHKKLQTPVILTVHEKLFYIYLNSQNISKL